MVVGNRIDRSCNSIICFDSGIYAHEFEVIPETIGQFTGLTDKNGKKIFEGDVLKGHYYYGFPCNPHRIIGIVKFRSPEFKLFGVKQYEGDIKTFDNSFEKIGNIQDNPELLEESK